MTYPDPTTTAAPTDLGGLVTEEELSAILNQQGDEYDPFAAEPFATGKMFGGWMTRELQRYQVPTAPSRTDNLEVSVYTVSGYKRSFRFNVDGMNQGMYSRVMVRVPGG